MPPRRCQKIIAVNRFYKPDWSATSQILTDLMEHLAGEGRSVLVITSRLRYEGGVPLPKQEMLDGVAVYRVWTSRFGRLSLIGRALDYATFYFSAFFALLMLSCRGDILIAKTDPPLISVIAAFAAKLRGAKLVNWCQDLFPEAAVALGLSWLGGGVGDVLRSLRNWSLRRAVFNAVLNEPMAGRLSAEGVKRSRIKVLPNWADGDVHPVGHDENLVRQSWRLHGRFVIGYSGNLGRAHMPGKVAELVASSLTLPWLSWVFIGGGSGVETLKAALGENENVRFWPYQPRDKLSESLSAPDLHLISLDPECEGCIMPSKLYGVRSVGRPVLFLGDPKGAVARELQKFEAGATLDARLPMSPDSIGAAINEARTMAGQSLASSPWATAWSAKSALALWSLALKAEFDL